MATILDSDLVLIGRGGNSFRTVAQDIKTFVEGGAAVTYRGTANFTIAPVLDPDPPAVGDMYFNTTAGTLNAGWNNSGVAVAEGDRALWNGTAWQLIQGTSDIGVESVSVTAPITDAGTPGEPNIGISDATNAAKGAVQLAKETYDGDGKLVTDNSTDVLIQEHFDELAGRITTAAGGGIQTVVGTSPIESSINAGGDTATISIIDATTGQKGAAQLTDTVAVDSTLAVTGTAVRAFAVPLDLSTLTELT